MGRYADYLPGITLEGPAQLAEQHPAGLKPWVLSVDLDGLWSLRESDGSSTVHSTPEPMDVIDAMDWASELIHAGSGTWVTVDRGGPIYREEPVAGRWLPREGAVYRWRHD